MNKSGKTTRYELKRLSDWHIEALRRIAAGEMPTRVAKSLGVSHKAIYDLRNCRLGQEELERLHRERERGSGGAGNIAWENLDELNADAVAIVKAKLKEGARIAKEGKPVTYEQLRTAERHLERQGFNRPSRVNVLHAHLASKQVIEDIKQRQALLTQNEPKEVEHDTVIDSEQPDSGLDNQETNV